MAVQFVLHIFLSKYASCKRLLYYMLLFSEGFHIKLVFTLHGMFTVKQSQTLNAWTFTFECGAINPSEGKVKGKV